MKRPPPEVIDTARLHLRPPRVADAQVIYDTYAQDPAVTRYLVWSPHRTVRETEEFLRSCEAAWKSGERFPWVIELLSTRQLLGMIELRVAPALQVGREPGTPDGSADVGYVLAQPHWGRGYVAEALKAVVDATLALPGMRRIWAVVDVDNTASQRVLEKAGLRREALLPKHIAHPNISREPRDVYRHAITR